jgi:hypothetical protein
MAYRMRKMGAWMYWNTAEQLEADADRVPGNDADSRQLDLSDVLKKIP